MLAVTEKRIKAHEMTFFRCMTMNLASHSMEAIRINQNVPLLIDFGLIIISLNSGRKKKDTSVVPTYKIIGVSMYWVSLLHVLIGHE